MAKILLSIQDLQARALAEIRKQPGCSSVRNIAINHVTDEVTGKTDVVVTASSELITIVGEAKKAVALAGQLNGFDRQIIARRRRTRAQAIDGRKRGLVMWPFSRSRQREIEGRLDRLAIANTIFSYVTAMVLRAIDDNLRDKVMGELREIISEIAPDSSNPLLLEEYGAQLLDQIEHMARASQDAAAPARPSTS